MNDNQLDQFLKANKAEVPNPPVGHEDNIVKKYNKNLMERRKRNYLIATFALVAMLPLFLLPGNSTQHQMSNISIDEILNDVMDDYGQNGNDIAIDYGDWDVLAE